MAPRCAVATDNLVAEDSSRFWRARLGEARNRNVVLGMVDFVHHREEPYDADRWKIFRDGARPRDRRFRSGNAAILIRKAGIR